MPLIVTVQAEAHPPRVRINAGGVAITRTGPDGVAVPVRGGAADVVYDYEAPQEVPLTYSDGVESAVVAMPDVGSWLVHLSKPEMSVPVTIQGTGAVDSPSTVRSLPLLGRAPHTTATGRTAFSSALSVHTFTLDEVVALQALLQDESVLFLSTHASHGWGPFYARFLDVSYARFASWCENPRRMTSLPFVVQERPAIIDADLTLWEQMPATWADMPDSWAGMPG